MQVAILIQKWQYDMNELPTTLVTLLLFEQSNFFFFCGWNLFLYYVSQYKK